MKLIYIIFVTVHRTEFDHAHEQEHDGKRTRARAQLLSGALQVFRNKFPYFPVLKLC